MRLRCRAPCKLQLLCLLAAPITCCAKSRAKGKWSPISLKAVDSDLCTITRLPASEVSPERFQAEFRGQKPLIMQGMSLSEGWGLHKAWEKRALLSKYGQRSVAVRKDDSGAERQRQNNGMGGSKQVTLAEYIESVFDSSPVPGGAKLESLGDINYQFDRTFLKNEAPEMKRDFITPPHFANMTLGSWQDPLFYLGPRGSGVGFHRHGEAWNVIAHGRKRWFLYPPEWRGYLLGVNPDTALDGLGWFRQFYPRVVGTQFTPMECVQVGYQHSYSTHHMFLW
jgi:hypothetical protein